MEYKNTSGVTSREERTMLAKISDLAHTSGQMGWDEVTAMAKEDIIITNKTQLGKFYYRMLAAAKSKGYVPATNQNTKPILPNMIQSTTPITEIAEKKSSLDGAPETGGLPGGDPLLEQPVINREYTSQGQQAKDDYIPPPNTTPPPPPRPEEENRTFDEIHDLPPAEKAKSAKDMAKMLVDLYGDNIPLLFRHFGKLSEAKIIELHKTGKVDFTMEVEIPQPQLHRLPLGTYIAQFNTSVDDQFIVDEQWKSEILPFVIEILKKRNMGMTPEQMVLYMISKDLLAKGIALFTLKKVMDTNLEYWMKETERRRGSGGTASSYTPPPPPAPSQSAQSPEPRAEDHVDFTDMPTAKDMVNSTVEILTPKVEEVDQEGKVVGKQE